MMINAALQEDLDNAVLCWLATVDAEGQPNVSPKELFCSFGNNALVIAEIASPQTLRNIRQNSRVCVSFVDIFKQRGFKLKGQAEILLPENPGFFIKGERLFAMAGQDFKVQAIIHIEIERIERIWAPSYNVFPERTVDEHIIRTLKTYGVQALSK